MRQFSLWVLLVVLAVGAVWYSLRAKQTSQPFEQEIKVGLILPLTGPAASIGELFKNSMEWKAEQLRSEGIPIRLYIEDTASDPKHAITAFQKLQSIHGVRLFYTTLSSASVALLPLAEKENVLLSAGATHPALTNGTKHVLRHANVITHDALLIRDFARDRQLQKVGLVFQQDDWGLAMGDNIQKLLKAEGITTATETILVGATDTRSSLAKVLSSKPDAIVLGAIGPTAGLLVKQAREQGYQGILYSSVGFVLTPDATKIAGESAKGMWYQTYVRNVAFEEAYKERFGHAPGIVSFATYTDLELLAAAIRVTQSTDPSKLVPYIKKLGTFQGTYEKVRINPNGDILLDTVVQVWK